MIWTIVLVSVGVTGLWLAPTYWWGWAITTASEALWLAYALTQGLTPLAIMAVVWGYVNGRNALLTRKAHHAELGSMARGASGARA